MIGMVIIPIIMALWYGWIATRENRHPFLVFLAALSGCSTFILVKILLTELAVLTFGQTSTPTLTIIYATVVIILSALITGKIGSRIIPKKKTKSQEIHCENSSNRNQAKGVSQIKEMIDKKFNSTNKQSDTQHISD